MKGGTNKEKNMPSHTHSPKTCRKLNCKYMEQDFIKSLNKPEIIKDSYRLIKQLDKQVNKLLVEHAFRNQVQGDESMKNKLKIYSDELQNGL